VLEAWRPHFFERWAVAERERYEDGVADAATELRRLAGEAQQDRCPSCDHKREYHAADDGRCWFTVDHGTPDSNLVCPCAPRRDDSEAQQDPTQNGEARPGQLDTDPEACRG
jgi:hypothetical protein